MKDMIRRHGMNALMLLGKVLILSLVLYFTFWEPTGLIYLAYISMPLYIAAFLGLGWLLSKYPTPTPFHHLALGLAAALCLFAGGYDLGQWRQERHIDRTIDEADQIVFYNLHTQYFSRKPENDRLTQGQDYAYDAILLSYDEPQAAFLFGSFDEFVEVPLTPDPPPEEVMYPQLYIELLPPAQSLQTYYPDGENTHRTCAISLTMADGSVYSSKLLLEPNTGFPYYLGLSLGDELRLES